MLSLTGFQYYFNINNFGIHLWFVSVILVFYILFIPLKKIVFKYHWVVISILFMLIIIMHYILYGSINGIYGHISSEVILRFLYHQIAFVVGMIFAIKGGENYRYHVVVMFISLFLYLITVKQFDYEIIAVTSAIIFSFSFVFSVKSIYPFIENKITFINYIAPYTFEIYLIHYSVIDYFNEYYHGNVISYIMVFLISIILAILINKIGSIIIRYLNFS